MRRNWNETVFNLIFVVVFIVVFVIISMNAAMYFSGVSNVYKQKLIEQCRALNGVFIDTTSEVGCVYGANDVR